MTKQMFVESQRVGYLTLVSSFRKNGRKYWHCICDCGNKKDIREDSLKAGRTISCGCKQKETQFQIKPQGADRNHPEYQIANGIFERCFNPNNCNYKNYGVRGITVNLHDFPNRMALADYILKLKKDFKCPKGQKMTIDRIDYNGNYSKDNIRISTYKTQLNNTRRNLYVDYNGITYPLTIICEKLGLSRSSIYHYKQRNNCSAQQAFDYYLKNKGGI